MSTADKDGRITQALGDLIVCLGMAMSEQILEQIAPFDALLDEAIKGDE